MKYQRPEGKSGGHGVGWTEVERYSFKVPQGWDEVPVSIADLGGTEIDMRYYSPEQGKLLVVVAPVARFKDIPFNTSVTIKDLGSPEVLISGFAPELYGEPLGEEDILDVQEVTKDGQPYYIYELSRHRLVSAAATGNRLYIMSVNAKSIQWRKHSADLLNIRNSFTVPLKEL
ncbi:domain-containing 4 [Micractinium conductrix]|uniref:Domain-containing 4 n=1 Tax=Micractinium conductrix TaxID=554055 RepID=A0A2P6VGJ2_9CHLO|nr:domain-containing 4 [Micractinium conductrix]|eukprot:PSC73193.1 domain-containing 4 [Micractinium conductrix]